MTFTQIKTILALYDTVLAKLVIDTKEDFFVTATVDNLNHCRWMCEKITEMMYAIDNESIVDLEKTEKVHRWLGFIQGVLFSNGVFTISEMKEHNTWESNAVQPPEAKSEPIK